MTDDRHDEAAREQHETREQHEEQERKPRSWPAYLRFAGMILTGMFVMYWTMFTGSWAWSDIHFSESRVFMALTMGGAMGGVMFAWMSHMYRNRLANVALVAVSVLLLGGGIALDRSQVTVDDTAYLRAMIPHHSLAITRSERANLDDVRVCELAVSISEAQRREILEMTWLIEDIERNGVAATAAEAADRPVPEFDVEALRDCPSG